MEIISPMLPNLIVHNVSPILSQRSHRFMPCSFLAGVTIVMKIMIPSHRFETIMPVNTDRSMILNVTYVTLFSRVLPDWNAIEPSVGSIDLQRICFHQDWKGEVDLLRIGGYNYWKAEPPDPVPMSELTMVSCSFFMRKPGIKNLLRNTPRLDKAMICQNVEFPVIDSMKFSGMKFHTAISEFLGGFRLPVEAQKIDRIVGKFAERFNFLHVPKDMRSKSVEALRTLFSLCDSDIGALQESWAAVLACISWSEYITSNPSAATIVMQGSNQISGSGILQNLRELPIESEVKLTSLCNISAEELRQYPARVFSLKNFVEISYYNMTCIRTSHLLGMKGSLDSKDAPRSFIKLILSVIKILSSISVLWSNSSMSPTNNTNTHSCDSEEDVPISSSLTCCSAEGISSEKCTNKHEDNRGLTTGLSSSSCLNSEAIRIESSSLVSCSAASWNRTYGKKASDKLTRLISDGSTKCEAMPDSREEDPFSFDEEAVEPSMWDLHREKASRKQNSRPKVCQGEDGSIPAVQLGKDKLQKEKSHHTYGLLCDSSVVEEISSLISDCLLASVKVFMNLTNDNPVGCQQIAAYGGLETLSTLLAVHFPSFRLYLPLLTCAGGNCLSHRRNIVINRQNETPLTDQQLDLLVALLGLPVNLIEKDVKNRSRLAKARVSLENSDISVEENRVDLILLLCSIFMANHGAGVAAGGEAGHVVSLDDDVDVVSQGEKEAEKMIVEAYAALLLAFLSTESRSIRKSIADCLPDNKLAILVPVLERFLEFHLALDMISPETHTMVLEVIESCRIPIFSL